jgi:hypothetical protein
VLVCRHHGIMMGQYALSMLPEMLAMIDEQANQNQKLEAMLIEATAKANYCNRQWNIDTNSPIDEDLWEDGEELDVKNDYRNRSVAELALEAPAWKHIGPDEEDAIGFAIAELEDADYDTVRQVDVLRKLLL